MVLVPIAIAGAGFAIGETAASMVGGFLMLASWLVSLSSMRCRCPSCGEFVYHTAWYRNVFTSRCLHCGKSFDELEKMQEVKAAKGRQ
jgi:DNA-directed RNA polymerase subunit RPC12/RpoP